MQPGVVAAAVRTVVTSETWSGGDTASIIGRSTDCGLGGTPLVWDTDAANASTVGIVSGVLTRTSGTAQIRRGFSMPSTVGGFIYAHMKLLTLTTAALRLEVRVSAIASVNTWYAVRANIDGTLDLIKNVGGTITVLASSTWTGGDEVGIMLTGSRVALTKNDVAVAEGTYDAAISSAQRVVRLVALSTSVFTLGPVTFELA